MSDEPLPPGYVTCAAEWDECQNRFPNPKPYSLQLWKELTFGQQARYGALENKNNGLKVQTTIIDNSITVKVDLPSTINSNSLSAGEKQWLQNDIYKRIAEVLHWIRVRRGFGLTD